MNSKKEHNNFDFQNEINNLINDMSLQYNEMMRVLPEICRICFDENLTQEEKNEKYKDFMPFINSAKADLDDFEKRIEEISK